MDSEIKEMTPKLRVAINGFGRIGRLFFRNAFSRPNIEIVAINDLVSPDHLAYLLQHDSMHGAFPVRVEHGDKHIAVKGSQILTFSEKDPLKLPWKELNIDVVVESTGEFASKHEAEKHLLAGAKKVVISAPSKDVSTFVMGVNEGKYDPIKDHIISNASCTTNCLAPMVKVLLDNFGIVEGLMTTVHAITSSQRLLDGPARKDWRGGRCAHQNLIPSSTGAATAVADCIPEVKGKITGMAFRVPVANVSAVDFTVKVETPTTYEEICQAMKTAAEGPYKGIIQYCNLPLVSSDFIGSTASCIFDQEAGIALNSTFFKLIAWYDNEMGYACRLADLIGYMANKA